MIPKSDKKRIKENLSFKYRLGDGRAFFTKYWGSQILMSQKERKDLGFKSCDDPEYRKYLRGEKYL